MFECIIRVYFSSWKLTIQYWLFIGKRHFCCSSSSFGGASYPHFLLSHCCCVLYDKDLWKVGHKCLTVPIIILQIYWSLIYFQTWLFEDFSYDLKIVTLFFHIKVFQRCFQAFLIFSVWQDPLYSRHQLIRTIYLYANWPNWQPTGR